MSAFEATIRVGEASVEPVQDQDGKTYDAHLVLGVMTVAPVAPGQALPIPLGIVRVPLDKKALQSMAKEFSEVANKLDDRSDIAIASDLASVERIAGQQAGLR